MFAEESDWQIYFCQHLLSISKLTVFTSRRWDYVLFLNLGSSYKPTVHHYTKRPHANIYQTYSIRYIEVFCLFKFHQAIIVFHFIKCKKQLGIFLKLFAADRGRGEINVRGKKCAIEIGAKTVEARREVRSSFATGIFRDPISEDKHLMTTCNCQGSLHGL